MVVAGYNRALGVVKSPDQDMVRFNFDNTRVSTSVAGRSAAVDAYMDKIDTAVVADRIWVTLTEMRVR